MLVCAALLRQLPPLHLPPSCSQSAAAAAAAANEDYLMGLLTEAGKELKALRKDMQELERQLVDAKVGVDERDNFKIAGFRILTWGDIWRSYTATPASVRSRSLRPML